MKPPLDHPEIRDRQFEADVVWLCERPRVMCEALRHLGAGSFRMTDIEAYLGV